MPALTKTPQLFLITIALSSLLYGCGGGSSTDNTNNGEESNTETTDRNDVAVQGTVWRFTRFQDADGSANITDETYANNFVYFAPFTESFKGIYGCASVTGTYTLNGNDLTVTEQESVPVDCNTSGADYESNLALTKRVLTGPSTISVTNDVLTLVSDSNESLGLIAAQEE